MGGTATDKKAYRDAEGKIKALRRVIATGELDEKVLGKLERLAQLVVSQEHAAAAQAYLDLAPGYDGTNF